MESRGRFMKRSLGLAGLLTAALAPLVGAQPSPPPDQALAPFLDDRALIVAHLDLERLNVEHLGSALRLLLSESESPGMRDELAALGRWQAGVRDAGGRHLFAVYSLADLFDGPFLAAPVFRGDARAVERLFQEGLGGRDTEVLGPAVLVGPRPVRERLRQMKPAPRPEVAQAFAAADERARNAALRVALVPNADCRRALEEVLPNLPPELGGGPVRVFTRGIQWAVLAVEPQPLHVSLVVQSPDAASASALRAGLERAVKAFANLPEVRQAVPRFEEQAKALLPEVQDNRLNRELYEKQLVALLGPVFNQARLAAERSGAENNFKQLALALHCYHDVHGHFPPAASADKQGKPLLSWRVHLLPFIEQEPLYRRFKLDEPWDSEHNRKLIASMPAIYRPSSRSLAAEFRTTVLAPRGEACMFPGLRGVRLGEVIDGSSITLLLVDADDDRAVIWTRPEDLEFNPADPAAGLAWGRHGQGCLVAMADGSVHLLPRDLPKATLRALFTRNGGERVDWP
jgi:hypothetical protein